MNRQTGIAERSEPPPAARQPESCGRCHARRNTLTEHYEYGKPLADTHLPALLQDGLYHADGRILDEVYVYGSFAQSRMHAAGVTCTDCHNPHSGRLHGGADANAVCAQCHLPQTFAGTAHGGEQAGACVDCHMPATTYMGVDERRDHSLRIPGAGDAPTHYGQAIAAGRAGPANDTLLAALRRESPAIATATMLTLLQPSRDAGVAAAVAEGLRDADPLVRIGGLRALSALPVERRVALGSPLLRDPVRGVRVEAARTLAEVAPEVRGQDAEAFAGAVDELRSALALTASLPESAIRLAELESGLGNMDAAAGHYRHALKLDERFAPARHAYGLFLVRAGQAVRALEYLRRAAELAPSSGRYVYVYGVALHSLGHSEEAIAILAAAVDEFPGDFDIGWALATIRRDRGDIAGARAAALRLRSRFPGNADVDALLASLEAGGRPAR
ncbi:MAG: tetratricopeptide repeat protein, partial [Pseudomonadota bacterium]